MKKAFLLLPVAGLVASCQGNAPAGNASSQDTPQVTAGPAPVSKQCYRHVTGRDTVLLELLISGDSANGHLAYRNFEKDSNEGTVRGVVREGKYFDLRYDFMSEGMKSERRIVFRLDGDQLYEGLASSFDKNGNPLYPDRYDNIRFDPSAYTRTDCP